MSEIVCQQPRTVCRRLGTRRVRMGTINGVTDPIVCESHAKSWPTCCYPVERFDPRSYCFGCNNEIDPDTCHCGESPDRHRGYDSHVPVPMGCVCGYADAVEAHP